jgi:tight adherence protein C
VSAVALLASAAVGLGCAALAGIVHPSPSRLAPRIRPYAAVARSALGRPADVNAGRVGRRGWASMVDRWAALVESRGDEVLERRLRQAGRLHESAVEHRTRQLAVGCAWGAGAALVAAVVLHVPVVVVIAAAGGFTIGTARTRAAVDRAVAERAERLRLELYTVNQLLAMHVRTGAGPVQAVRRIVDRGHGAVVDELATALRSIRAGATEPQAFRDLAELTPEPTAARAYRALATGIERGSDLADALLALGEDLRDARRDQLRQAAVRRRAAMLVPTIAVLAPVMILFVAAPLPSIVLGSR